MSGLINFKKLIFIHQNQKGFTLIELLVAVAITAVIGSAITMAVNQLFTVSIMDRNRMEAVKQVENALHYINRDVQMAKADQIQPSVNSDGNFLELNRTDYTDPLNPVEVSTEYTITNGILQRTVIKEGDEDPVTTTVARHIDPASSYYSFSEGVLEVKITASIAGYRQVTEARTLYVIPRIN